jgi:hypothetical protein
MIEGRRGALAVLAVLGLPFLAGCSTCGTEPPPPSGIPECVDSVDVAVTTGPPPVFSWTPDCLIGKLIVIQGGPEEEYWASETLGLNIYRSPIVYGVHPPGAVENQVAQPLTPGDTVTVVLFRWISSHPDSLDTGFRPVGSARFVP